MSQYVPYYALVAAPLHRLTRKDTPFPSGNKWIKGSDYDMAYHHIKSLILDRPLYLWKRTKTTIAICSSKSIVQMTVGVAAFISMRKSTVKTKKLASSACSARGPNESYRGSLKHGPITRRQAFPSFIKRP
jgi:hypothetical protein